MQVLGNKVALGYFLFSKNARKRKIESDDVFFQPDWAGACWVVGPDLDYCWAGRQALVLFSSAKTRKKKGRWGLRPWPLRCLS